MSSYQLNPKLYDENVEQEPIRAGFGRGLKAAGEANKNVIALCADLTESTQTHLFAEAFPERFIQVGIAEQNLVAVASGLAAVGKVPFAAAYAAFSPGRNWEQIKTTVALNNQPVKIVSSHAGIGVGPDGATHQMLEDIAMMRVMPNMVVIVPGDSIEAEKATRAIADNGKPSYLRLARPKTPIFSTADSPFRIGDIYKLRDGTDVTLIGTGMMTYQLLMTAKMLDEKGISAEVLHVPTIKPLDTVHVLMSVRKTGRVVVAEEAQVAGGLGGAISELLGEHLPTPILRIGIDDRYGESGEPGELFEYFELTAKHIIKKVEAFIQDKPQYHRDK